MCQGIVSTPGQPHELNRLVLGIALGRLVLQRSVVPAKRVLIVEDDAAIRRLFEDVLRADGYAVVISSRCASTCQISCCST